MSERVTVEIRVEGGDVAERTVRRWIEAEELSADKRELAELRGRYAEVCERLERTEAALAREQQRFGNLLNRTILDR